MPDQIPEMVQRLAKTFGELLLPDNNFSLRDLILYVLLTSTGPMNAEQRQWQEKGVDKWLIQFATAQLKAMRIPTDAMLNALMKDHFMEGTQHEKDSATLDWQIMCDAALKE